MAAAEIARMISAQNCKKTTGLCRATTSSKHRSKQLAYFVQYLGICAILSTAILRTEALLALFLNLSLAAVPDRIIFFSNSLTTIVLNFYFKLI